MTETTHITEHHRQAFDLAAATGTVVERLHQLPLSGRIRHRACDSAEHQL